MSATRAKKVKMATKSCPECDQQVGVGGRAPNTRASGAGARGQAAVACGRWLWRGRLAGVLATERVGRPSGSVATAGAPNRPGRAEPRGCRGSARSRGPAGVHLAAVRRVPVACKSCPCGYIFISRKLLNAKHPEKAPSSTENKHEAKRRRTERVRREKINSTVNKDLENRKRSRSNSHSDHIRRGRGRPKSASAKKHEEEREKQEKEIDIYANLSDEKAFVFSVALAEINRKIINQRLIL
uniref:Chromosome 18 C16orf87 homolog n=1 Tax=Bos taurus TaxID=9913 RepID=A0AAF6YKZ5_BOVIN